MCLSGNEIDIDEVVRKKKVIAMIVKIYTALGGPHLCLELRVGVPSSCAHRFKELIHLYLSDSLVLIRSRTLDRYEGAKRPVIRSVIDIEL